MKKNKIKTIDDTAKALKKCGHKKKALIVIATLAGTYIVYYIVKQVKKRKARELSERLQFGSRCKLDNEKKYNESDRLAEYVTGYGHGYDTGYNHGYKGYDKQTEYRNIDPFDSGFKAGYKMGFEDGYRTGSDSAENGYAEFADRAMEKYDFDEEDVANEDNK